MHEKQAAYYQNVYPRVKIFAWSGDLIVCVCVYFRYMARMACEMSIHLNAMRMF